MKDFCIGMGVAVCRMLKMVRERFLGVFVVLVLTCVAMVVVVSADEEVVMISQQQQQQQQQDSSSSFSSSSSSLTTTDAYEKIESYGFPQGILPHTIKSYILESNGRFTLYLEGECKVLIQSKYPLVYDKTITGFLSYGQLQQLQGIRVKAFYVWWSISTISRSSDHDLLFSFGILSAKFPLENFDDPPICERKLSEGGGGGGDLPAWSFFFDQGFSS
jgi:hypothetical protein